MGHGRSLFLYVVIIIVSYFKTHFMYKFSSSVAYHQNEFFYLLNSVLYLKVDIYLIRGGSLLEASRCVELNQKVWCIL